MSAPAIDCRNLTKRYRHADNYALKDLTFEVLPGEVYGFLGPNGAGKSTAIRTLLNFIQPSSGSAIILGLDIVHDSVKVKRRLGYLSGEVALYPKLTGRQFLDYMAALQPLKHHNYRSELVTAFQAKLHQPIHTLSKGNRQKLGVIQAFMHEPEVLILDEPTSGLDPLMQAVFYQVIEAAKQRGAAIFLSSHDLAEVHKMCDRIGFIKVGKLVAERNIAELQKSAAHRFDITFKQAPPLDALKKLLGASVEAVTGRSVSLYIRGDLMPLFALLGKTPVTLLEPHAVDLEDEFLSYYRPAGDVKS